MGVLKNENSGLMLLYSTLNKAKYKIDINMFYIECFVSVNIQ